MSKLLRLLIVGTGGMANSHVAAFRADPRVEIVGGVDVLAARAEAFAARHGIGKAFGSLEEAIAWGGFDAAANVTPDSAHHPTTMALLAAGKPVFCEKPLAESYARADEMARTAEAAGLPNMINLSYRNVPALAKAAAMIAAGEIGEIRHVEASYRQSWLVAKNWGDWRTDPKWLWRLSEGHGSKGVLGDIGIHILDFVTHAVGMMPQSLQAQLMTFHKAPGDRIGDYPLDANDSATMALAFPNGALGVVHMSRFMPGYSNDLKLAVFGNAGALELHHGLDWTELRVCSGEDVHNQAWRRVISEPVESTYRRFITAVMEKTPGTPSFRHGAELQRVLDLCFTGAAQARVPIA